MCLVAALREVTSAVTAPARSPSAYSAMVLNQDAAHHGAVRQGAHLAHLRRCGDAEADGDGLVGQAPLMLCTRVDRSGGSSARSPVTPRREMQYMKPLPSRATRRTRSGGLVGARRKMVSRPAGRAAASQSGRLLGRQVRNEEPVHARGLRVGAYLRRPVLQDGVPVGHEEERGVVVGAEGLQPARRVRAGASRRPARAPQPAR